jgi:hypothetical protein
MSENTITIICFVVAILLFIGAGFAFPGKGNPAPPQIHLGWFGMVALTIGLWVQFM